MFFFPLIIPYTERKYKSPKKRKKLLHIGAKCGIILELKY